MCREHFNGSHAAPLRQNFTLWCRRQFLNFYGNSRRTNGSQSAHDCVERTSRNLQIVHFIRRKILWFFKQKVCRQQRLYGDGRCHFFAQVQFSFKNNWEKVRKVFKAPVRFESKGELFSKRFFKNSIYSKVWGRVVWIFYFVALLKILKWSLSDFGRFTQFCFLCGLSNEIYGRCWNFKIRVIYNFHIYFIVTYCNW